MADAAARMFGRLDVGGDADAGTENKRSSVEPESLYPAFLLRPCQILQTPKVMQLHKYSLLCH